MTDTTYKITVVKRSVDSAVKNANVHVTVYGEQGNSGEIFLDKNLNNFKQGGIDVFSIDSQEPGNINRIRIRYDKGGHKPGWVLTSVVLDNETTGKEWVCPCNRWLADDESDGRIERELNCIKV